MARGRDSIDLLCEDWARVKRQLMGLRKPLTASEYLGPLRSTLGQRRDLHAGARSPGRVEQHFPEVFTKPEQHIVNAVFKSLPEPLADVFVAHYVFEHPRDKHVRAELMGISRNTYWDRLRCAKARIEGALVMISNAQA